jgi:hypothetical protein
MAPNQTTRARSAGRRARDTLDSRPAARSEDLHVRSYAHEWSYDLHVAVVDADGHVAFEADYYLQPGDVESEMDELPPGEYEVRATLDNETRTTGRCRIGTAPDRTAVIEVGNGVLSLTEGLPTR